MIKHISKTVTVNGFAVFKIFNDEEKDRKIYGMQIANCSTIAAQVGIAENFKEKDAPTALDYEMSCFCWYVLGTATVYISDIKPFWSWVHLPTLFVNTGGAGTFEIIVFYEE